MEFLSRLIRPVLISLFILLQVTAASAHMRSASGPTAADAVLIPSLSHGQMTVIARHRSDILALGKTAQYQDKTVSRLMSYAHLQHIACLWGLVPGSIADEASPFNECSHADLAAAKMLLMRLTQLAPQRQAANRLRDAIEADMMRDGTSLTLCRYSDLPFNTGEILAPHWHDIPGHFPSLLALLGVIAMASGGIFLIASRRAPLPRTALEG